MSTSTEEPVIPAIEALKNYSAAIRRVTGLETRAFVDAMHREGYMVTADETGRLTIDGPSPELARATREKV